MTEPFFQRVELTETEVTALRTMLESDDWTIVMKVHAASVENLRRSLEFAEGNQVYKVQGGLAGLRNFPAELRAAAAPPQEQAAQLEAYEQIRQTFGRDAGGGY